MVIPSEGAGYELEASALMASSKNKADAKRFLDWTLSDSAIEQYKKLKPLVTLSGVKPSKEAIAAGLPEDVNSVLFKMDFKKSAKDRKAILSRWRAKIER